MENIPVIEPVNETVHQPGSWKTVAVLAILLLVAESAAFGYYMYQSVKTVEVIEEEPQTIVEEEPEDTSVPPAFAMHVVDHSKLLVMVDRSTGEATTVYTPPIADVLVSLFAVPQIGYNGNVYLDFMGMGENPALNIQVVNVASKTISKLSFDGALPFASREATKLSPSQTRIAALYSNKGFDEDADLHQAAIFDLATGKKTVVGTIADGEYFSHFTGENTFAGAEGYFLSWDSENCFSTWIYKDGADPEADEKVYKETKTFCAE